MLMTGSILNAAGILIGGIMGLMLGRQFTATTQLALRGLMGVFTVVVGLYLTWSSLNGNLYHICKQMLILIMALLFLVLSMSRFQRWLRAEPGRVAKFTASALLIGGAFTFFYWGVRVPAGVGYGWFPQMPWH